MRIISSFHDYYDCVARCGEHSPFPIYLREPKVVESDYRYRSRVFGDSIYGYDFEIDFCGKIYRAIKVRSTYYYSAQNLHNALSNILSKRQYQEYCERHNWFTTSKRNIENWFNPTGDDIPKSYSDFNTPISCKRYEGNKCITVRNCRLKDYEFHKVKDTYSCYQELEQYLSALAAPQEIIPEISNADKIAAHGFNRFSFRKDKSK